MDTVKVRELPVKGGPLSLTDLLIIEDNDGTKTTEVAQFRSLLQQSIYFNTLEDMKSATLHEGDVVTTLGYREINDGGGAIYKIVYAPTDLEDEMLIHYLYTSDTLRAHLVHNGSLNILQCGAFGDGVADDFTFITKALTKGLPLVFPKRTYKVTGPLEFPSNSVVDFQNATILCTTSACVCLGLDKDMKNIIIRNGNFIGKYGIELYPYAENITIENCTFDGLDGTPMDTAISINGVDNVSVIGCTMGIANRVTNGVEISSGVKDKESLGNGNIMISSCRINCNKYGINCTSTIKDNNIIFNDNIIVGKKPASEFSMEDCTGIQLSCNSDSVLISSCSFEYLYRCIRVTGVVDIKLGCTDIVGSNVQILYSILSDECTLTLSGMQRAYSQYNIASTGEELNEGAAALFERMSGTLYLNTVIDTEGGSGMYQARVSLSGKVVDSFNPLSLQPIAITRINDLINESNVQKSRIPGYKNVAIDCQFSGNITDLMFPSLNGQIVALYSSNGAVVKNSIHMNCGSDITLNQYTPVIFRNVNGLWYRIA